MSFLSFLGIVAADAAVEGSENQITFENFVVQAKKQSVLSSKPDCGGKPPNADNYLALYDALVDAKVIAKKSTKGSFLTWTSSYTVSTTVSLDANNLKSVLENRKSPEYTEITKCFAVDFAKLSHLLTTYKYDPRDQINVARQAVGGKRKTRKRRKLSRRAKPNKTT